MGDLVPFVVGMAAADVVLCAVFSVLYRRERREHLRAWSWAHALDAARQGLVAITIVLGGATLFETASEIAKALAALALLHGALRFAGQRTHPAWFLATGAVCAWAVLAEGASLSLAASTLPGSILFGFARIGAGWVLLRAEGDRTARHLSGFSLLLWGAHSFNFPFLRDVAWFAPWGFTLSGILAIFVAVGILLLHLDRARSEERASAARYQELFDGAIEGFFRTSPDGRILAANPALVRILGYETEADLLALDILLDVYVDPADRPRLLGQKDGDTDVVKVRRRDGAIIEVSVHARRVRDAQGNIRYFEGSMRDITEEQRLRDELAQAQRLEALGRMAGGIAHDFNNMLGAIVAATDLARLRIKRGDSPDGELRDARDAAMRAADLTRQLLALARRTSLNRRSLDLRAAVDAAVRVLGRVIGERVQLEVDLGEHELVILADPGQVDQVLMNLALNARDAMPDGGRLRITVARTEASGAPEACLRVEDSGLGMDDTTRRHMFDPFFSTKPHGIGYGLGLAMVYGAVTQSGGRIEVESAPAQGTRIQVFFPLVVVEAEPGRAGVTDDGKPRRSARVLLVEDEPALRRSVEAALREAGHEVRTAESAGDALDRLRDWPFDLLVTDVVMPGLSGPDLARAVRARDPHCAVIFVTGYAPEPIDPALAAGCELLAKPFTIEVLLDAVARGLEARDAAGGRLVRSAPAVAEA